MAVYTHIDETTLYDFLRDYDVPALVDYTGIQQGVENSNYLVETRGPSYILTVFEGRVEPDDIPFFLSFTDHLSQYGIACPRAVSDMYGRRIKKLEGKPAVLVTCLKGRDLSSDEIAPDHCRQLGEKVAIMHKAGQAFEQSRPNTMGLAKWKELAARCLGRGDEVEQDLPRFVAEEIAWIETNWIDDLPGGVVHADLFPDNVFFDNSGAFSGVIDFYFACNEVLIYDLAMTCNAWCFDSTSAFVPGRFQALLEGYQRKRALTEAEKEAMNLHLRASALRILVTRLHDWLFHDSNSCATPKDPRPFITLLRFHQQENIVYAG
jgi:homoserine kinase type II